MNTGAVNMTLVFIDKKLNHLFKYKLNLFARLAGS